MHPGYDDVLADVSTHIPESVGRQSKLPYGLAMISNTENVVARVIRNAIGNLWQRICVRWPTSAEGP